MRVPPDQSVTDPDTAASASSGSGHAKLLVTRVSLRGKQERLDALVTPRHGVREVQQHARVALHRAAHVAQQHERRGRMRRVRRGSFDDITAGAEACRRSRAGDPRARPAPRTHRRVRRSPGDQTSRASAARASGVRSS